MGLTYRNGVECSSAMAEYYDKRFETDRKGLFCKMCDEPIEDREKEEQYGLCDDCFQGMSDCLYDDMCKGCIDEKYCKDHNCVCEEYDKELERRISDEV